MSFEKPWKRRHNKLVVPHIDIMKDQLIFSRPTKHWHTVIGIIAGLFFLILGLVFLIFQYHRVPLLVFGSLFSIMGFYVFAGSIDAYFIRPSFYTFQIEKDKISWGIKSKTKEIRFDKLEQINFEVMNGIAGDITFKFNNGDVTSYNNYNIKLLSESDMLEAFKFLNINFEGKTLLNNA